MKQTSRKIIWSVITVIVVALIIAFGIHRKQVEETALREANTTGKPVVKIGVVYPLSGNTAKWGKAAQVAGEMFFEEFNKKADEHKFHYQLLWADNMSEARHAQTAAMKLINVDSIDAAISSISALAAPVSLLAEKNKVLSISVTSDPEIRKRAYNFSLVSDLREMAEKFYEVLLKKGVKRISIVGQQSSGQIGFVEEVQKLFQEKQGIQISSVHYTNPGEYEFRILIQKIKREKPDYIYAQMLNPEIDVFMKQLKEANVSIPVSGLHIFNYIENKNLAEGLWWVDSAIATPDFMEKYSKKAGHETLDYGECFYTILDIITAAYEGVGEKDNDKAVDFIMTHIQNYPTVIGNILTDRTRLIFGPTTVQKIVNGKMVIVSEEEI